MPVLIHHQSNIYSISKFWAEEFCDAFVKDLEESGLFSPSEDEMNNTNTLEENIVSRNKYRINFDSSELAKIIWEDIKFLLRQDNFLPIPVGINESFRFYKYKIGQEFKKHTDSAFIKNDNEKSFYSLLIYLNEDFEGGDTIFENIRLSPKKGTAVFFPHDLEHSGGIVTEGVKYILRTDIISKQ